MTDTRQSEALQALCTAVSRFGEVSLAALDDDVINGIQDAIDNRDGRLVTQVESSYLAPLKVTILLSQVVDGERTLMPLLVVADMPHTIQ